MEKLNSDTKTIWHFSRFTFFSTLVCIVLFIGAFTSSLYDSFILSYILVLLASVINIPLQIRKKDFFNAFIPIIITCVAATIVFNAINNYRQLSFYLHLHKTGFSKVIKMIENDELTPNEQGIINLPLPYKYLSSTGKVLVDQKDSGVNILFYYGKLPWESDGFEGFMYSSSNSQPDHPFYPHIWRWRYFVPYGIELDTHWYFGGPS